MKKIGLIADIHSNLVALKAVLEDMPEVEKILCAGDLIGYGPQPKETIELVKSKDINSCMGNHDYAVAKNDFHSLTNDARKAAEWTRGKLDKNELSFLNGLKEKIQLKIENYEIFIAHGTPRKPLKEYLYPSTSNRALLKITQKANSDIILLGHTHIPLKKSIQGKIVLNPGAVGQPRDRNPKASYMLIEIGEEIEIAEKRVKYDIEKTTEKIEQFELPEEFGTRLNFGW